MTTTKPQTQPRNVLGQPLQPCCDDSMPGPTTGFYRDGYCRVDGHDQGKHAICAIMTDEFLAFSKARGNDLITPHPEWEFPGLKAGDQWCLCALRWVEAYEAGCAPKVNLAATHEYMLEFATLDQLKAHALAE